MRSLKDLIDERRGEQDIQYSQSKTVLPGDSDWIQHKQMVNSLKANYLEVLKEKLSRNPNDVKYHKYTVKDKKQTVSITIDFPELSEKFDTILSITELEGEVQTVRYITFRSSPAKAYIRTVVGRGI